MSDVEDPPGSFGHGIAIGFALCAVMVHIALVGLTGNWLTIYDEMHAQLPLMTRVTTSVAWQFGVPFVATIFLGGLILRRPRSMIPYIVAAVLFTVATACTYWYPTAPVSALAGNLHAD